MTDAQLCPACGVDSDGCYCPGVLLASPPDAAYAATRAVRLAPAGPAPAVGEKGAGAVVARPWLYYASAMVYEGWNAADAAYLDLTAAELQGDRAAHDRLAMGAAYELAWDYYLAVVNPAAYTRTPDGRIALVTP